MTNSTLGRWLLVALVIVGFAIAAPAVSAHDDEATHGNVTVVDEMRGDSATTNDATWMAGHMTDHLGHGPTDAMESHMGETVDQMTQDMAAEGHTPGPRDGQRPGC